MQASLIGARQCSRSLDPDLTMICQPNNMGIRISIIAPILIIAGMAMAVTASAEIYKHIDKDGRITYSNVPVKGAEKLYLNPTPAQPKSRVTTPDGFPKVARKVQQQRDSRRREILAEELAAEEKFLSDARQALRRGEASHEILKVNPAQPGHNMNSKEQMKKLREQVLLHENNITALKRELAN